MSLRNTEIPAIRVDVQPPINRTSQLGSDDFEYAEKLSQPLPAEEATRVTAHGTCFTNSPPCSLSDGDDAIRR